VNDVFVPGLIAGESDGFDFLDCAFAELNTPTWAAAMVMAAVRRKLRRLCLVSSDILIVFISFNRVDLMGDSFGH
jgi:hypothetical protein